MRLATGALLAVPLTLFVPGFHVAHGYQVGEPYGFAVKSVDINDVLVLDWHDRDSWGIDGSWTTDPNESTTGQLIPSLPSDYSPDYNNPATIDPNDPGTSAVDPNALGPNPAEMLALSPPGIIDSWAIDGNPDNPGQIVNIDHNVVQGVPFNYLANTDVAQTSLRIGNASDGSELVEPTSEVNWRNGDFSALGSVWVGSSGHRYHCILNLTSSGTFQIGNNEPAPVDGLATHSDASLIMARGYADSTAIINQSAGNMIISGGLVMGVANEGGAAVYNLSGGTLTLETLDPLADETADIDMGVSNAAVGTINQSGGTVTTDSRIILGGYEGSAIFGSISELQGTGVYNISAGASTDGDFDFDGDVDGDDFLEWQTGGSPGGIGSGDLGLWQANFGATGGGVGGTATLNQGVGTSNEGANKGAIVVGSGGHGTLNIDGSTGDVVIQANAIVVAERAQVNPGGIGTAGDATGLVKITGDGATITVDDSLIVGEGVASFEFVSASSISSIDVGGEVYIEGATLTVDLTTSPPAAGDLLLIAVGSVPEGGAGTFAGLVQGAVVPNSGGRSISYIYGDGNDIGLVAPSIAAVPEPTSAGLCLLAMAGWARFRRRGN